jgi:2-succinyl-5-enolpyruvyl-6-hydroxy-3-cyclohexene-1-carboxylate synthase
MPIRDVDSFSGASGAVVARANRGASGIDGTVASAVGVSIGRGGPVTVLLGDLAMLHDLNSLSLVRSSSHPVVVIVINNDGGGIFSFLPVAEHTGVFETYFGTPHGLGFESAAAMFGLPYRMADGTSSFEKAYAELCRAGTSGLIEVRTDREENRALHRQLQEAVREAAAEALDSEPFVAGRS